MPFKKKKKCNFALMSVNVKKWFYLITLSIIWGSSYILIKKGLLGLTPLQLGSIRIFFTALILLLVGFKSLKKIPKKAWRWIIMTGYFGTFFPSYLFAISETVINSSVVAVLNGMTPLFTLILGITYFKIDFRRNQAVGIMIGFFGTVILVSNEFSLGSASDGSYALLIVMAAMCYAINVNLLKYKLPGVPAMAIALGNFVAILPAALILFLYSGFSFTRALEDQVVQESLVYIFILAFFGTALAKVMFNDLVAISSPVFSISITYLLPIVAIGWGLLDNETFTWVQWMACAFILFGVYLVTENKKSASK